MVDLYGIWKGLQALTMKSSLEISWLKSALKDGIEIKHARGVGYTITIMLQLSASLINRSVVSLRTSGEIAVIESVIINPNNLKIEGFYCNDKFSHKRLVLLAQDIRDNIKQGIIVNDHDVLTEPEELVRLKSVLELEFDIMGKPVETVSKHKVGKINDFAVDDQTLYIQKLYVGPSIIKSLTSGQLSIDRDQIVEITNRRIVIKDLEKPIKSGLPVTAPAV